MRGDTKMGNIIELNHEFPIKGAILQDYLPHRYPFLLIDKVVSIEGGSLDNRAGRTIHAIKNVSFNEPFFPGHFPGNPIMPGVLILESMAQTCAMCCFIPVTADKEYRFYIAGSNKARFRKPVVPGDTIEHRVTCIKDKKRMLVFDCKAYVDGELVAESEIMASVQIIDKE